MTLKRLALYQLRSPGVAGRRRAVEQVEMVRPVLEPVAQHVDRAALGDLALEPRQELAPRGPVLAEVERLGDLGLRLAQEGRELGEVDAIIAVVVVRIAADPAPAVGGRPLAHGVARGSARIAGRAGQRRADQPLEAAFGGVGGHRVTHLLQIKYPSSTASRLSARYKQAYRFSSALPGSAESSTHQATRSATPEAGRRAPLLGPLLIPLLTDADLQTLAKA